MANNFFDISRSYRELRNGNAYDRLEGIYRLYSGHLNAPSSAFHEGSNHIGLFDILTLGTFFIVENGLRQFASTHDAIGSLVGARIDNDYEAYTIGACLLSSPFNIVRALFAAICTAITCIPILIGQEVNRQIETQPSRLGYTY